MKTAENISEVVSQIRESLRSIASSLQNHAQVSQETVEDVLSQFLIWTGSLGAAHKSSSDLSLEYRLKHAPHIRKYIWNILCRLSADSRDLQSITTGEKPDSALREGWEDLVDAGTSPSRDDATRKPDTEAEMLLDVISGHLKSLFRISVLVRKATSEDRFQRAIQSRGHPFMDQFDMDYLSTRFPKLNTFPHASGSQYSRILVRLGQANVKRRQFIRYCREHSEKLKADMTQEQSNPMPFPFPVSSRAPAVKATDSPLEMKAALPVREISQDVRTEILSSKATTLPPNRIDTAQLFAPTQTEDDNISATTVSSALGKETVLSLPRLESLKNGKPQFECPICSSLQTMNRNKTWQRHAFRDLKAYVCTAGEQCDELMFPDRDSWFKHEIECHRLQFVCSLCPLAPSVPRHEFRQHLLDNHGSFDAAQLHALESVSGQPPRYFQEADCPFCDDWGHERLADTPEEAKNESQHDSPRVTVQAFKVHVAKHQEQISIFAIPRAAEDQGSADSRAMGRGSGSSGSEKKKQGVDQTSGFDWTLNSTVRDPESQLDVNLVGKKFAGLNPSLVNLLAQAVTKRRKFIKYNHERHHTQVENSGDTREAPPSGTLDDTDQVEATGEAINLYVPQVNLAFLEGPFMCTICCNVQSFQHRESWEKHVYEDLRPYLCTLNVGCEDMFPDRDSWFEHELQHRSQYVCYVCDAEVFKSREALFRHFGDSHSSLDEMHLLATISSSLQSPEEIEVSDCPFCDGPGKGAVSLSTFKNHVAEHLERIALFAVYK